MSFGDTIDITQFDEAYDRLIALIDRIVEQTQEQAENRPLPSIIIMTKTQAKQLRRYPQVKAMYGTSQKYILTPHNVMEIVVR